MGSIIEWLKSELKKLKLPKNLPKGVCHCGSHPSNFPYKNYKLITVLDFDDASYIYLLYDVANMVNFGPGLIERDLSLPKQKTLQKSIVNTED